jgi:hypothetical protein
LGGFEHGILDAEMTGGGCLYVPSTHTEALGDVLNPFVFIAVKSHVDDPDMSGRVLIPRGRDSNFNLYKPI